MTDQLHRRTLLALMAATTALAKPASAADDFPDRQLTMVVPFAPGGASDIAARLIAPRMAELLGKSVVVENRSGAGSIIGSRSVMQARADGHTLLMAPISVLTAPLTVQPRPFDPVEAFRVVSLVGTVPFVLVVRRDFPARNLAEFHRHVAENAGKLNYGSVGVGTPQHLGAELYKLLTSADIQHVAYRGTAPALTDLMGGRISMVFCDLPGAAGQLRSGEVRGLASLVREPIAQFPDLPVMSESDPRLRDFEIASWALIAVSKATPAPIVARLSAVTQQIVRLPDVAARLRELGFVPRATSPADGDAFLQREKDRWSDVIRRANITQSF